jgi:hypothetical protein
MFFAFIRWGDEETFLIQFKAEAGDSESLLSANFILIQLRFMKCNANELAECLLFVRSTMSRKLSSQAEKCSPTPHQLMANPFGV